VSALRCSTRDSLCKADSTVLVIFNSTLATALANCAPQEMIIEKLKNPSEHKRTMVNV
jgi:hypothetical protein